MKIEDKIKKIEKYNTEKLNDYFRFKYIFYLDKIENLCITSIIIYEHDTQNEICAFYGNDFYVHDEEEFSRNFEHYEFFGNLLIILKEILND